MHQKLNEIYLKRSLKIVFHDGQADDQSKAYASTVLAEINALGFTLTKPAYEKLCQYSSNDIVKFHNKFLPVLKEMIGADRRYRSFYPNFPQDVMSLEEGERFFDQFLHYVGTYIGLGTDGNGAPFLPKGDRMNRFPLTENTEYKLIDLGSEKDFRRSMQNLMESRVSLPAYEKENIRTYIQYVSFYRLKKTLPEQIPNKENFASIAQMILDENKIYDKQALLQPYFKTATDVLRFATALSNGDVSFVTQTKFKHFNRPERRLLLELLNHCGNIEEDMSKYPEKWKRLGEIIHPGEFVKKHPEKYQKAFDAITKIRNNEKIKKYMGRVEIKLQRKDDTVFSLLKERPGVFAEKLNQAINVFGVIKTLSEFQQIAEKVSIPVLLRLKNYYEYNRNGKDFRVVKPKGRPVMCIENMQKDLKQEEIEKIVKVCRDAMVKQFCKKEPLGCVFLDDSMKGFAVPSVMRDKNESMRFIPEGSVLEADAGKNFIRPFVWWTNNEGKRIDVDLSVTFFNKSFERVGTTSYYSDSPFAIHSGDITDGGDVNGDGVAEFIDIDKKKMKTLGADFAVFSVSLYSGEEGFHRMVNCSFGFMEREKQLEGQEFEPKTIKNKIELHSNATTVVPCIYDVINEKFIWEDRILNQAKIIPNVENSLGGIAAELYKATQMHVPMLDDLLQMHVEARGELVENIEDADIVFTADRGDIPEETPVITPYDTDIFISQYMDDICRGEQKEKSKEKENLQEIFCRNSDMEIPR